MEPDLFFEVYASITAALGFIAVFGYLYLRYLEVKIPAQFKFWLRENEKRIMRLERRFNLQFMEPQKDEEDGE